MARPPLASVIQVRKKAETGELRKGR